MPREILEIAFAKGMIRQTRSRRDGASGIHASPRDNYTGSSTPLAGVDPEICVATEG
jgi:hypothetical protein